MQKNSEASQTSEQKNYQKLTSSLSDSLAKIYRLLTSTEKDSREEEVASSLKQLESLGIKNPNILYVKMSDDFSHLIKERTLSSYCKSLPTLGMMCNGNSLILSAKEACLKTESGYTLSDILEENPDPKYFLSEDMTKKLLERVKK